MKLISIPNYPHYSVSDDGRVFSEHKDGFLLASPHKDVEYLQVSLWANNCGTSFYVHRLVAQAFLPNPLNLPEVNHIDGDRTNNTLSNLEWVDRQGNAQHAVRIGLRVYTNRLTHEEFVECLECVLAGESYNDLSLRVPYKVPFLSTKLRSIARSTGQEEELNQALKAQRAARNRKVLSDINVRKAQRLS